MAHPEEGFDDAVDAEDGAGADDETAGPDADPDADGEGLSPSFGR